MQRTIAETGGTRNVSRHHHAHVRLEKEFAELHGKETALVFTSGWSKGKGFGCGLADIGNAAFAIRGDVFGPLAS